MRLRWAKLTLLSGGLLAVAGIVSVFGAADFANRALVRRAVSESGLPLDEVERIRTDRREMWRYTGISLVIIGAALASAGARSALESLPATAAPAADRR